MAAFVAAVLVHRHGGEISEHGDGVGQARSRERWIDPTPASRYPHLVSSHIVYQVINHDREETFFGVTNIHLEKEMERLAKDPKGPAKGWQKGDTVEWRPMTDMMEPHAARLFHKELESSKGRSFTLIPTFVPEPEED